MKVLVFIDHDIVVRHFLHSQAFSALAQRHEVVYVLPEVGNKRILATEGAFQVPSSQLRRLPVLQSRQGLWQKLTLTEMLRYRRGPHHSAMRRFHRTMAGPKAATIYTALGIPGIFPLFKSYVHACIRRTPNHALQSLLGAEKPDLIIHPSVLAGLFINDLVEASHQKDIPLLVIMNSWDNPSTKRAMTGNPDWLFVWGPQTKGHAIEYMGIDPSKVITFGAAQFDLYRNPPRVSREQFARRHNVPSGATILLYAGSSKETDEFSHLQRLNSAIANGELGETVVIYRPHPWGGGGKDGFRIAAAKWDHVRIEQSMQDYISRIAAGQVSTVSTPDYQDTHDLLSAIDALISPLSTIVIEGALHGKPALCFLPDQIDHQNSHYGLTLPLTHFEDFFKSPDFQFANGEASLISATHELLTKVGDAAYAEKLRIACRHFVESFEDSYADRLADFIDANIFKEHCG